MSYERLSGEGLIPLSQARRLLPAPPCLPTMQRWVHFGVRARSGAVVKLEGARVGRRWFTTAAAITRFVESLTRGEGAAPPVQQLSSGTKKRLAEVFGEGVAA